MHLPIAERELRVAARMPKTYWGRLIAGSIFAVVTLFLLWIGRGQRIPAQWAGQVYISLSFVALMMCMFASTNIADSISGEKRNGTLGFLFLTNLKGVDVVIGKLAASGLSFFCGLLGVFPILSISMMLGGVSAEAFFKTSVTLINALFFSLSIGLWISAKSWEQKKAMNASVWVPVLFLWGFPGLSALLQMKFGTSDFQQALMILSPVYQISYASPFATGLVLGHFWKSVLITHIIGWAALIRACQILPNQWQDRPALNFKGRWQEWWHGLRFGAGEARAKFRTRLLNLNAVHWLSAREKLAPFWTWVFVVTVLVGWVGIYFWIDYSTRNPPPFWALGVPSCFILMYGLRLRICALSAEVIARDRFSGALELLLSTTLTERDVERGLRMSFYRINFWPVVATVFIGLIVFAFLSEQATVDDMDEGWLAFAGLVSLFISDVVASFWTGIWMACISKTAPAAPGAAVLRLLVAPWVLFFVTIATLKNLEIMIFNSFASVFLTWFAISFLNNIFWIKRSRRCFYERLREVAAERYQPAETSPWWRRFARGFGLFPNSV